MPATIVNRHNMPAETLRPNAPASVLEAVSAKNSSSSAVAAATTTTTTTAAAANTTGRARFARCGNWLDALRRSDVKALWAELHRLVSFHPLVRASWSAGLLIETNANANRSNAYTDLTQELFVTLLSKERFQHYLDTGMTNAEIECEIGQLELTNLLTAELRKRHPESYRLARRISTVIQTSNNFRRFDTQRDREAAESFSDNNNNNDDAAVDYVTDEELVRGEDEPHRRLADRVYGLREWRAGKPRRSTHEMDQRAAFIPMRQRDTRLVGCTGDAQVIISNADLEDLIISVLEAIDSPADVRTLRSLVMSRLPVMDIYLVPLGGTDDDDDTKRVFEPVDTNENPEQVLLRREREDGAGNYVAGFLEQIKESVRGKAKQYDRMIGVLWFCYLNPDHITQLEAAERLGVSDSLISDYRRRIEAALRALDFNEIEEARRFERALREHVRALVVGSSGH